MKEKTIKLLQIVIPIFIFLFLMVSFTLINHYLGDNIPNGEGYIVNIESEDAINGFTNETMRMFPILSLIILIIGFIMLGIHELNKEKKQ